MGGEIYRVIFFWKHVIYGVMSGHKYVLGHPWATQKGLEHGKQETRRCRPRWYQTLHRQATQIKLKKMPDTWHPTHDTWHLTCDTWWRVNILSKFQLPISYSLGVKVFWRYFHKISTKLFWFNFFATTWFLTKSYFIASTKK